MALSIGSRLGSFEITGALGAGGMGEVYRARDTRLKRDVALKILPESFATDPERLARFRREAELLAALNHPNIAAIYGLEESDGTCALVMELVDGPTLADRIADVGRVPRSEGEQARRGPAVLRGGPAGIPIDEALPIARQIADALEAAHEQGIVHRDLKPANVKVRADGVVKVLDFGLAKLAGPAEAGHYVRQGDLTAAPTITSPAMMTGAGIILGTAAYMAPEQARGKEVDKRADIWAFGCVLYEMLTGRRAFDAGEVSDTLAMVLMKEIDWTSLPAATPPAIRTLLRRCLEKDRKRRLPDIAVARLEIDEVLAAPASQTATTPILVARGGQRLAWTAAAAAAMVAISVSALHFRETPPEPAAPIRFSVTPPPDMSIPAVEGQWLSPDGRHIAFRVAPVGSIGGPDARLAIRSFDEDEARILAGTEGAAGAFWSPDSRFLGFFAAGKLQKIDVTGGPPQVLCDLPFATGAGPGGTWNGDGTILVGAGGPGSGLLRVSSGGGTPVPVTKPDPAKNEVSHRHPWFLPDGRYFLYVVTSGQGGSFSPNSVHLGSLDGDPPSPLMQADALAVYAAGFVLFVRDGTLLAQPFDTDRLVTMGDPLVIAQDVAVNLPMAVASLSASATGMLSYRVTSSGGVASQLVWIDRSGKVLETIGEKADQSEVRLSPDGTRVAVSVLDPTRRTRDIWIHDLTRDGLRTRFTFDAGEDWSAAWSPDGRSLVFSAGRPSPLDLYRKNADGSGAEERLVEGSGNKYITSWSADGRFLLYHSGAGGSQTSNDVWVLPLTEERKPRPLVQTPFSETRGYFSPDGRWVAYQSNESGTNEIYVMPFPAAGGKWQISTAGGEQLAWRRDGKELFFLAGNSIMGAEVDGAGTAFKVGAVRPLFEARRRTQGYLGFGTGNVYAVAPDGQRFLVNVLADEQSAPPPITVITNWTATLQ
ncbi:MAG: protein kinase domain-containing protein [Vicinamibacterales bacterium]